MKNKTLSLIAVAVILGAAITSLISCSRTDQETVNQHMAGKTIKTLATTGKQNQVTLITENWKPGTYIASLLLDGKITESCKFSLTK